FRQMSKPPPHVHLSIKSNFTNVELVQIVVEEALKQLNLLENDAHWVGIAVREAVANAVKHGNRQDPEKKVEIDFGVEGDEVVIKVADEGVGFDPGGVDDPLAPENMLRSSGRGIYYMKQFMDHIDYSFRPDGGTEVTMRKSINSSTDASEEKEEE
ncbi:MAG: ATP-binding protein, partial [Deltaproteobacteria bacterium]|nr:ATP-binding protein [Deltaproteobacteria bacterium]